jgi:hypothetical protein
MIGHGHACHICRKRTPYWNSRNNPQHAEHAENNKAAAGERFDHGAIIIRFCFARKAVATGMGRRLIIGNRHAGNSLTLPLENGSGQAVSPIVRITTGQASHRKFGLH